MVVGGVRLAEETADPWGKEYQYGVDLKRGLFDTRSCRGRQSSHLNDQKTISVRVLAIELRGYWVLHDRVI